MRKLLILVLILAILQTYGDTSVKAVDSAIGSFAKQTLSNSRSPAFFTYASDNLIVTDFDDEDWDDDDDWDDEDNGFYDDEDDWDDEEEDWLEDDEEDEPIAKEPAVKIEAKPSQASQQKNSTQYKQNISKDKDLEKLEAQVAEDAAETQQNRQQEDIDQLAKKVKRSKEDLVKLYSQYGNMLDGLNPNNPKDLKEIEKLIEIVGVPKRKRSAKAPTTKKAPIDDPIVNFSARNIPVRDAFATLARVSGKSITVSGQIQDRDTISVVEINDQPFTRAFLSLVEAADVDFSAAADNYTILKRKGQKTTSLRSSLTNTDIDLDLPLEDRYADLVYDNEDLASIIKDLANKYGVDVVMTATPTERVTLRVRGVNIEDAFELVFSGSQFSYTRKDDTFVVYSAANKNFSLDKKTILFPLKYLEAQEAQKLLPNELKNLVQVSENQNAFIAEGSKSELTKLYEFIRTIDKPIPQVELNVKLVEVTRNFARNLGLLQNQFSLGRFGGTDGFGFDVNLEQSEIGFFQNRPTYSQATDHSQIKVNQRLLVTSGKSAKINFDEDRNILLNSGEASQTVGVVQNQRIQRITAGNSMDITPIVGGAGIVTVKVDIEVSVNDEPSAATGVPPRTVRRRLSSEIQITNHETIAIGGLFDNRKGNDNVNEIPILSKIPVIGHLFSSGNKSKNLTELIILITPHVRSGKDVETIYIQAEGDN